MNFNDGDEVEGAMLIFDAVKGVIVNQGREVLLTACPKTPGLVGTSHYLSPEDKLICIKPINLENE